MLVVDADVRSLEGLAEALLDCGFAVRTAATAAEALAEARRRRPTLVLSDVAIPGMDGFQLCAELRRDPEIGAVPVVLLASSAADVRMRERGATAGVSDYLTRPIDLPRLIQVVRQLSTGSTAA
ncbi:MAG: response regulator [Chloroflexi bacterium]|nr:response regulator [Chloroflexota bacterium]